MKIALLFFFSLIFFACDKKERNDYIAPCGKIINFSACGVDDIGNNLSWLNDIISISTTDKTGNYIGRIWYKKFNDQDFIVTDMMLGSGGLAFHTYNCSGEFSPVDDISFYKSLTEKDILYCNICIN